MTEQEAIEEFNLLKKTRIFIPRNNTIDIAIKSLEKQMPKKPLDFLSGAYLCPSCKRNDFYKSEYLDKQNYCDYCGQAIKWE